jgi:hypothetical protein
MQRRERCLHPNWCALDERTLLMPASLAQLSPLLRRKHRNTPDKSSGGKTSQRKMWQNQKFALSSLNGQNVDKFQLCRVFVSNLLKKSNGFCGIPSPVFSAILNQRGLRQKTQYMKPSEGYPYQFIKEKPMWISNRSLSPKCRLHDGYTII